MGRCAFVVLPAALIKNPQDFKIAIHHELQHHRSGDTLWAWMTELLHCGFFINPAIYLWQKTITEIQEFSCDEALIGRRRVLPNDYGSCLLRVAEAALGVRRMQVGTTCMNAKSKNPKSFLRRRIEMFRQHEKPPRKRVFGLTLGLVCLFATVMTAYATQSPRTPINAKVNQGHAEFDPKIQAVTEKILREYVKKFKARGGFVLVSEPSTGRLLAAANVSDDHALQGNWALSYGFEPASAMKTIIAASAIDHRLTSTNEVQNCENGTYSYGAHVYHDWKPFQTLTTAKTIVYSSNICGIKIAEKLGTSGLHSTLTDFGFGVGGSASEFPEAMVGQIPDPNQMPAAEYIALGSTGYTENPGLKITPLEILQAYGAIANEGRLMKPIMSSLHDSAASVVRQVISPGTALAMKKVLTDVVLTGTGKNARSSIYTTAGKTSTAYNPNSPSHHLLGGQRGIGGFVGFAPVDRPRLVVYVAMIDPVGSQDGQPHGNEHAAPVFREVIEKLLPMMP
nr:Penicillin binding protein transpeptidase domain protein [uncultured bacterium]